MNVQNIKRAFGIMCFAFLLSSCAGHSTKDFKSPDGTKTISIEVSDPGAMGVARARISLTQNVGTSAESEEQIFRGDGWPFDAHWVDNDNAILVACDAHQYEHKRVVYTSDNLGKFQNRLVVEPTTVINQTSYC